MSDGGAEPPQEQDRQVVDRLEAKRAASRQSRQVSKVRDFSRRTMSVLSDPEEFATNADFLSPRDTQPAMTIPPAVEQPAHRTDAEGDDELPANDEADGEETRSLEHRSPSETDHEELSRAPAAVANRDYFTTKQSPKASVPEQGEGMPSVPQARLEKAGSGANSSPRLSPKNRPRQHARNVSSATTIFKPMMADWGTEQSSSMGEAAAPVTKAQISAHGSGARTPPSKPQSHAAGQRTPKRPAAGPTRMRPILPTKNEQGFRSTPNLAGLLPVQGQPAQLRRRPSLEMDLVSDIGDNKAIGGGFVGALPSSFAAHLAQGQVESRHAKEQKEQQEIFAKVLMARMNTLEESFRDVIHEMRDHMRPNEADSRNRGRVAKPATRKDRTRDKQGRRPVTAGSGADADTLEPSPSSETRASVHSEAAAATTENGKGEKQESVGENPPFERPASR